MRHSVDTSVFGEMGEATDFLTAKFESDFVRSPTALAYCSDNDRTLVSAAIGVLLSMIRFGIVLLCFRQKRRIVRRVDSDRQKEDGEPPSQPVGPPTASPERDHNR